MTETIFDFFFSSPCVRSANIEGEGPLSVCFEVSVPSTPALADTLPDQFTWNRKLQGELLKAKPPHAFLCGDETLQEDENKVPLSGFEAMERGGAAQSP